MHFTTQPVKAEDLGSDNGLGPLREKYQTKVRCAIGTNSSRAAEEGKPGSQVPTAASENGLVTHRLLGGAPQVAAD